MDMFDRFVHADSSVTSTPWASSWFLFVSYLSVNTRLIGLMIGIYIGCSTFFDAMTKLDHHHPSP
jgi:hypothetical protein